ncbi:hypothetical protein SAMN05518849_101922 [Sphingobium sp. AP50]|nr:hypothetical protein SAMN05518849_101922 [Sphingobium sp. AP50]
MFIVIASEAKQSTRHYVDCFASLAMTRMLETFR